MDAAAGTPTINLVVLSAYWPGYAFGWDCRVRKYWSWPPGSDERLEHEDPEGLWQLVRADAILRPI